jgi:hypothetical protein
MLGASNLSASAEELTHYLIPYLKQGKYHDYNLLPAQGQGWYDVDWNWHPGNPDPSECNSFSGSHNALQSNITILPLQKVGVVVLMNTRLEQLVPTAPGARDIALNIAKMTMNSPYELLSNRGFYTTWAVVDSLLLLLMISILWQAFKLRNWTNQYRVASRSKRIIGWAGIVFDFLLCIGILVLPNVASSRWNILLFHRPDFAIPVLVISVCLGTLGFIKVVKSQSWHRTKPCDTV